MAEEFNVNFLGTVPIDPQFVMLVETGKRPVYPVGTSINGCDIGHGFSGSVDGQQEESQTFVEKYKMCSLFPVFRAIVSEVDRLCEEKHTRPLDTS